ncbi:efflux RND transporter periplasmic adaptor subunit [Ancylomarina longa]|uniref:Efflux RND transporter periplasmic adaptor subunit n=1 Tax=Ancylomarina longa TaxID=2487017 RepID=A0A434AZF9_9BACT|nr:efflux RND transporter periplasmic adaptor subunit [Ancylomarina longa]RUT79895.1 efflux RND transporter periplasmic adaptor subunit [Ancylomarina longa]
MQSKKLLMIGLMIVSFIGLQSCGKDTATNKSQATKLNVKLGTVKIENQPEILSFSGKLEAATHSNLSTRLMGQIAKYYVEIGQKVNKDQLLLQIHDKDILAKKAQIKANLLEAEAAFKSAEKDFHRYTTLFEQKSASQKELDDITTHYNMAKARVAAVKQMVLGVDEMLRYASIRAPYSGTITRKYMNEGDLASPGMPLLAIEQAKQFKVIARIPETDIAKIKKNDLVKVQIRAIGNKDLDGVVTEVNPSALYTGNQFEAKVMLNADAIQKENLYSGMYAKILLEKGGSPRILLPKKALFQKGQLTGVYTVSQMNTAILRWVRTGKTMGDKVEILSGLNDGEKYILSYEGKIWDGVQLNIQ